jgi:hypothetical protein
MNITLRPALFLLLTFAALAVFAGRAAADDAGEGRIRLIGPSWAASARGNFLFRPCSSERGLAFCIGGEDAAPPSLASRRFTAFTRLAGMFMGRVDALQAGDWKFRFILDIR